MLCAQGIKIKNQIRIGVKIKESARREGNTVRHGQTLQKSLSLNGIKRGGLIAPKPQPNGAIRGVAFARPGQRAEQGYPHTGRLCRRVGCKMVHKGFGRFHRPNSMR